MELHFPLEQEDNVEVILRLKQSFHQLLRRGVKHALASSRLKPGGVEASAAGAEASRPEAGKVPTGSALTCSRSLSLLAALSPAFSVLDFLPALFAGPASAPTLLCPMHRPEAIPWIRSLLQEHWSSVSTLPMPAAYALVGVHSAKATLLSWARQLNLSESLRRIQGHLARAVQRYAPSLCSVIWLFGYSGVNLLCARHPILLHLPLASCLTGCCKTPAVKV